MLLSVEVLVLAVLDNFNFAAIIVHAVRVSVPLTYKQKK